MKKTMLKMSVLLISLALAFAACEGPAGPDGGGDDGGPGDTLPKEGTVYNEATWNSALQAIKDGGSGTSGTPKEYTIEIDGDFAVLASSTASFGSAQFISVTLIGSGTVSLKYPGLQGALINLPNANQTLIIDSEDLILKGRGENNRAVIHLDNAAASLELKNGVISGNTSTGYNGGGVYVNNGTFTMEGGAISGNSSAGGGVCVDNGTFTMHDGEISGNTNTSNFGGGVYVNNGTFTMHDGKISGNSVGSWGGGVYVNNCTFTMHDGEISGNSGVGGGVYVSGSGTFTMEDGVISGNTASGGLGGGVFVDNGSTFTKTQGAGIIYGYETPGNPLRNKAGDGSAALGHAVYFWKNASNEYYRDSTLEANAGGNITTAAESLPASSGATAGNWTKK
jgi:hypothetical protein